jgi:hypothetical protein
LRPCFDNLSAVGPPSASCVRSRLRLDVASAKRGELGKY